MNIRAHIAQRFYSDVIDIYLVDHFEGRHRLLRMGGDPEDGGVFDWRWGEWEDDGVTSDERPTVVLPYDSGRALLTALIEHYQGAEDTRALRRDYDNERKRVDDQAKVIGDIARMLAGRTAL